MQLPIFRFLAGVTATLVACVPIHMAQADCWPPLDGTSQITEAPVQIGDRVFGSGSYSFFVSRYSVPSLHCEESINSGPRDWYLMVESGRVVVKGEPEGTRHGPLPPPAPSLPPLGNLPPFNGSRWQDLGSLPDLPAQNAMLPPLIAMPKIENLPPLR